MMIFACVALLSACGEKDTTPADTPSGGEENPVETPSKRVKQIVLSQEGYNDKVLDFAWEGNLLKSISASSEFGNLNIVYSYEGLRPSSSQWVMYGDTYNYSYQYEGDRLSSQNVPYGDGVVHYTYLGGHVSELNGYKFEWENDNLAKIRREENEQDFREYTFVYDGESSPFPQMYGVEWINEDFFHEPVWGFWSKNNVIHYEGKSVEQAQTRRAKTMDVEFTYDEDGYPARASVTEKDFNRNELIREKHITISYSYYD